MKDPVHNPPRSPARGLLLALLVVTFGMMLWQQFQLAELRRAVEQGAEKRAQDAGARDDALAARLDELKAQMLALEARPAPLPHDPEARKSLADANDRLSGISLALKDLKRAVDDAARRPVAAPGTPLDGALTLSREAHATIRRYAIISLGILGGEAAEKRLIELAQKESDAYNRAYAFDGLLVVKSDRAVELLGRAVDKIDEYGAVRLAESVYKRSNEGLAPVLGELALKIVGKVYRSVSARTRLARAMRRLRDPAACGALVKLIRKAPPKEMGELALDLRACARRGQVVLVGETLSFVESLSRGIALAAPAAVTLVGCIGSFNDPRATPFLTPCLDSPHKELQRAAMQALRSVRDPLAAEALVKAYTDAKGAARTALGKMFEDGYPGVRYDAAKPAAAVVAEAEMAALLEQRKERVERLKDGGGEPGEEEF